MPPRRSAVSDRLGVYAIYAAWLALVVSLYPVLREVIYRGFFLLVALALFTSFLLSLGRGDWLRSVRSAPAVYLFFLVPYVTVLWSIHSRVTLIQAGLLSAFAAIFLLSHVLFLEGRTEWLYKMIYIVLPFFSLVFLYMLLTFGTVRPETQALNDIIGSTANHIAAMTLPLFPYLYVQWKGKHRRALAGVGLALLLFIIAVSQSRAAYGLLVVQVLAMPFVLSRSLREAVRNAVPVLTVTGIAIVALVLAGQGLIRPMIQRFQESLFFGESLVIDRVRSGDIARFAMLVETVEIITSHPLTGIGYHTFQEYMRKRYETGIISHNIVLTVWGEMGILGLASFFAIVAGAFRRLARRLREAREWGTPRQRNLLLATMVALIVLLAHAMVRPQLTNPVLYVVLAACFGLGVPAGQEGAVVRE